MLRAALSSHYLGYFQHFLGVLSVGPDVLRAARFWRFPDLFRSSPVHLTAGIAVLLVELVSLDVEPGLSLAELDVLLAQPGESHAAPGVPTFRPAFLLAWPPEPIRDPDRCYLSMHRD